MTQPAFPTPAPEPGRGVSKTDGSGCEKKIADERNFLVVHAAGRA